MNYKTHKTWKLRLCSLAVFLDMVLFSHIHSNTFNIFSPTFKPELHWIQQPANNWLHVRFHVYLHFNRWITLQQRPFILHNSVVVWTFTTIQDHPVDRWLQHKILSCLAHWRLIKFFFFKLKEKKKKERGLVIHQREFSNYLYKTYFSWLLLIHHCATSWKRGQTLLRTQQQSSQVS